MTLQETTEVRPRGTLIAEARRIKQVYSQRFSRLGSPGSAGWRPYSCFDPAHLMLHHSRERVTLRLLDHYGFYPLTHRRILDVGCGAGLLLQEFLKYGAMPGNLYGIDLLKEQIMRAHTLNPALRFFSADASELPFADGSFDIVMQWTVFSSILDRGVRDAVAREMLRVLKPRGIILWYDFWPNNPANPDVRGIRAGEIRRLFPECKCALRHAVLAPVISRSLARHSALACEFLERIPYLCSHFVGVIQKPMHSRAETGISAAQPGDCDEMVRVHLSAFDGFYLTALGSRFLKELYTGFLRDPSAICLVARRQGRIAGFVVGLALPRGFIARALARRCVPILWALLRSAGGIGGLLRRSVSATRRAEKGEAVLFSLAVDPSAQHRGLGRQLVQVFLEAAHAHRAARVVLTTDSENNEPVKQFYQHLGFRVRAEFVTPERRRLSEFVRDLADVPDCAALRF